MTDPAPLAAFRFREATAADVPAVVALVESAYRGEASRAGWTTEADLLDGRRTDEEAIAALVADPASVLLLAVPAGDRADDSGDDPAGGGGPLGCCELRSVGEAAYFGTFAVRPARQGRGTGRALLAHADAVAVARFGARALEMTVIAQRTDLIAYYERAGFTPTGERRPFPYGDPRFGVPRRDDLEFVVLRRPTGGRPAPRS